MGPTWHIGRLARTLVPAAALVVIWILLWGELSVANVVAGLVVALGLLWAVPSDREDGDMIIRPLALLRLGVHVVRQMVVSNALVARAVIKGDEGTHTGVLGVPMPDCSPQVVTVVSGLMALTPGSMPVEADAERSVLYVHVLDLRDLDAVRQDLFVLRDLVIRALGSPSALAHVEAAS